MDQHLTHEGRGDDRDRQARLALFGIVLLALLLRLFRIGAQNFWIDEIFSYIATHPREPYSFLDYIKDDLHGVLYHVSIYGWSFLGDSEGWLRLPSALAGTLSVFLLYRLGTSLFSARVGLLSAFLLAVNPIHIYYSQSLRNYSFAIAFVLISFVALSRALEGGRKGAFAAHGLATAAAILSNFSALFVLAAQVLTGVFSGRFFSRKMLPGWLLSLGVILILTGYWGYRQASLLEWNRLDDVQAASVGEKLRGETTLSPWAWPYTFYVFSVGNYVGPSLYQVHMDPSPLLYLENAELVVPAILVFGSIFLLGVLELWRRGRHRLLFALCILIPFLFTTFLARQNVKVYNPRYVLVALPFFAMLWALGLERLRGVVRGVGGLLVLGLTLVALGNYYFNPRYAREDVRGAADLVEHLSEPEDLFLVPTVDEVFLHYYGGINDIIGFRTRAFGSTAQARAALEEQVKERETIWYVEARPWVNDRDGWIHEVLGKGHEKVATLHLSGVTVTRYALLIRRDLEYEVEQGRKAGASPIEVVVPPPPGS